MRCVAVKLLGCEEAVVGVERRWLLLRWAGDSAHLLCERYSIRMVRVTVWILKVDVIITACGRAYRCEELGKKCMQMRVIVVVV